MADQGDQMPEVGDDKSDPELRVIRYQYRGWDILSKVTQKDFLLTLEKDAVGQTQEPNVDVQLRRGLKEPDYFGQRKNLGQFSYSIC